MPMNKNLQCTVSYKDTFGGRIITLLCVHPEPIFWRHMNITMNNWYVKFHSNIPFTFEVMSKKRILDAFFLHFAQTIMEKNS